MENVQQMAWPDAQYSDRYEKCADVLLVLDNGTAVPCHSQILSLHSAVLCNMLQDLGGQHSEKIRIPLPCFTEAQCSALLKYLYNTGVCSQGVAFEKHAGAADDVVRFAHTYDVPHALRQVQEYMISFVEKHVPRVGVTYTAPISARSAGRLCDLYTGKACANTVVEWALMADKYDMQELCGHCERAMAINWEHFQDLPDLVNQLSSSTLQRIAKGLSRIVVSARAGPGQKKYPGKDDFIAWRQQQQQQQQQQKKPRLH